MDIEDSGYASIKFNHKPKGERDRFVSGDIMIEFGAYNAFHWGDYSSSARLYTTVDNSINSRSFSNVKV